MTATAERTVERTSESPARTIDMAAIATRIGSGTVLDVETYRSTYGRATHDSGSTSDRARRRDARALNRAADGYTREAVHLARSYDHAIGWALTYGLPVYEVTSTGVHPRCLDDLTADINAFEAPLIKAQENERYRQHLVAEMAEATARYEERFGR